MKDDIADDLEWPLKLYKRFHSCNGRTSYVRNYIYYNIWSEWLLHDSEHDLLM